MSRRFLHVVPDPRGGWKVKGVGSEHADRVFERKDDAMEHARTLVRRSGGELVVHGKDGRIRETTTYPAGFGSLKGQFVVRKGIDIAKPIYEQAARIEKKRVRARTA